VNEPAAPSGRCPDPKEWNRARTFHHDPWAPGISRRRHRVLPRRSAPDVPGFARLRGNVNDHRPEVGRARGSTEARLKITEVAEFELALAHLDVPELV
jgi:hypothetical protein